MKRSEINYIQDATFKALTACVDDDQRTAPLVFTPQFMASFFIGGAAEAKKEQGRIADLDKETLAALAKSQIKDFSLSTQPEYENNPELQQQIAAEIDLFLKELPQQHYINTTGEIQQKLLRAKPVQKLVEIQEKGIKQVDLGGGAMLPIEMLKETAAVKDLAIIDLPVMQAIASFWASEKKEFTSSQVYGFLCGKLPRNGRGISVYWQEEIERSLHRLMGHVVKMDVNALSLSKTHRNFTFKADTYHGNLIYIKGLDGTFCTSNGHKFKDATWLITEKPIFLAFCEDIKQISTLDENARQLPAKIRPKVWHIELRECLLWQIDHILQKFRSNAKNNQKEEITEYKINYGTLFAKAHTDVSTYWKKQDARNFVKALLRDWQEKGYIIGWKVSTKRRSEDGIYILKEKAAAHFTA